MSACCYDDDRGNADIYKEVWHKSHKAHTCCECHTAIPIGDDYQCVTMLGDGKWYMYKTCEPCADLREALEEVSCPLFEGLAECFTDWLTNGNNTVMKVNKGSHSALLVPSNFIRDNDNESL